MIPAITNHLWQSTLFALAAGLLTLALRKNRAQTRYWVWMAASVKFFVPFSLLVALGGHLSLRTASVPVPAQLGLAIAIEETTHPFVAPVVTAPIAIETGSYLMQIFAIVWGGGILAVLCHWLFRWFRIRAVLRSSLPSQLDFPVPARTSTSLIEPGIFGVFRPVLLVPTGMIELLAPEQLRAILVHEWSHVHRRDNLTAFLHMVVEAIFWFHPLVWWIGTRLVDERERACDEEVLRRGSEPQVYAEGILNICKLYVESPLACMSGVTGSNLKKRIETIMHNRVALRLNFAKKAALAFAGMAALATPIVVGMINASAIRAQSIVATMPRFEVASIKPTSQQGPDVQGNGDVRMLPGGRLVAEKALVRYFIQNAYGVKPFQISGGPAWINSAHYDIDAKAEGNPNNIQMRLMMQALLEDRFKLKLHHETKELPVYELTVAKSGVKLQEPKQGSCASPDQNVPPLPPAPGQPIPCGRVVMMMSPSGARMQGGKVSMMELIRVLSNVLGRTVIDRTGFTGTFDVHLEFTPDESLAGLPGPPAGAAAPTDSIRPAPSADLHGTIFAAIQEQLGLKLESAKGPVDMLVIDSVEKPSAN